MSTNGLSMASTNVPKVVADKVTGLRARSKKTDAQPKESQVATEAAPQRSKNQDQPAFHFLTTPQDRIAAWEASRINKDGTTLLPGQARPLTRKNLWLALELAPSTYFFVLSLYWEAAGVSFLIHFLQNFVLGLLPTWKALTAAALMQLIQDHMTSDRPLDPWYVTRVLVMNFIASHSDKILNYFLSWATHDTLFRVDEKVEGLFLQSHLNQRISVVSNPRIAPLLAEASAFAGFEAGIAPSGPFTWSTTSASNQLNQLLRTVTTGMSLFSNAVVLMSALRSATGDIKSWASAVILLICLVPHFIEHLHLPQQSREWKLFLNSKQEIRSMAQDGTYKQEILAFSLSNWVMSKWEEACNIGRKSGSSIFALQTPESLAASVVVESLQPVSYALMLFGVLPKTVSIANLQLCQTCSAALIQSIRDVRAQASQIILHLFQGTAFQESLRLQESLAPPDNNLVEYVLDEKLRGMRIDAKNVSFTYPGQTSPTLHDINLSINPGEKIAIVGFNGAGKSTLAKVLMGLYDATSGTLLINGQSASSYTPSSLYAHTAVCFQDFSKYNATAKENVGIGNHPFMNDNLLLSNALKRGGADAVVGQLPEGLEQKLDKNSVPLDRKTAGAASMGLSAGEWQRLALSRAFMRAEQADLIVFDEPSAALDARAEADLFDSIDALSRSKTGERLRTLICISHRFNTIRKADRIAVVEGGTIVEIGSHDALMKQNGRYAEFFNLQARGFLQ